MRSWYLLILYIRLFAACYGHHFRSTMSRTDLYMRMVFKVVKQFYHIGAMQTFMKSNFNLCME